MTAGPSQAAARQWSSSSLLGQYDSGSGMPQARQACAFQGSASSYALNPNASLTPVDHVAIEGERATCWVVVTSNRRYAFMTNTLTNTVSSFRIATGGQLELLGNTPTGSGFPSDEALSRGSRYLYVLVPSAVPNTMSHIDFYRVRPGGSLTQIGSTPSDLPPGVSGLAAR